jgi:putative PIN family toxin of toxin-antitoxin system
VRTLLDEYLDVIRRRHIVKKYQDIAPRIQDIHDYLQRKAIRVSGSLVESVLRDPDDNFLIACAIEGNAQHIVSGDKHLLELRHYREIVILSPRDFVEQTLD